MCNLLSALSEPILFKIWLKDSSKFFRISTVFEFPGATVGGREFREDLYDSFFVVFTVQGRQVGLMHEDPIIDREPGNSDLFQVQAIQDVG
jgi:hypothetical protein